MHTRQSRTDARSLRSLNLTAYVAFLCLSANAFAAEEVVSNPPPARITNSVPGIRVRNGFRVELVASDSVVSAPTAMAFDENGRLFVAEMRDYPDRRDQSPHLGRIRLLEDADGDGVFESSTVFADNLPLPSAVICYDGGIFVAATPDILYLKDVNDDGVADERKTVFSGFCSDSTTIKSDSLINNFNWGLDNRIHGGASGFESSVTLTEGNSAEPVTLGRSDFSFDPRTLAISPDAGSAQTGLTFDNQGRKYFCDLTHPLRQDVFQPDYFARNPYFVVAQDAVDIVSPATPLFRFISVNSNATSNPEPRGRAASSGAIPSHSLFTRAHGCVIYRGNSFASNYVGSAFIADSEAHCIHRAVLRDNGITMTATRPADEQGTEFLLSTDASFRPVQIVNSPDGALYIADFRDGGDTGQILRIVPDNFKQPKAPHLREAKTYDLAAALAHANGWHRDTAARLLCEKRDPAAIGLLTNMVNNARNPLARLHALATLQSFGGLNEPVVLKSLRDSDPSIRERALPLCEKLTTDALISDSLWNQLRFMADDNFPRVRYQLALTLGHIRHQGRPQLLVHMLQRADADLLVQNAVFSSLAEGAGECFVALAEDGSTRTTIAGLDLLRRLALMIGTQGSANDVSRVLDWLDRATADEWDQWSQWPNLRPRWALWPQDTLTITTALGEGLRRTGSSLALVDQGRRLNRIYTQALFISTSHVSESVRIDAIRAIGVIPYSLDELGDWPSLFLGSSESEFVQSAAISAIAAHAEPRVTSTLLSRWSVLSPPLRKQVVAALCERTDRLDTLLAALEKGGIPLSDLSVNQINLLRSYSPIRQRALQIFGPLPPQRSTALQNFRPALRLVGDANHGRELYQARCANCHRTGDSERAIGPDLTDLRALNKDKLLSAIVQPSADLPPKYLTYVIETKNNQLYTGLLHLQTVRSVTLLTPNNDEIVLPRANIQSIKPQAWSLMPDTLDQGLTPKAMSDLLQYIVSP